MKWIIEKWPQTIFRPIQLKEESSSNFSQHAKSWSWGESCVMAEACCNLPGSMEKVRNPSFLSTHFLSSQTNAKTGEPLDFFFPGLHPPIHPRVIALWLLPEWATSDNGWEGIPVMGHTHDVGTVIPFLLWIWTFKRDDWMESFYLRFCFFFLSHIFMPSTFLISLLYLYSPLTLFLEEDMLSFGHGIFFWPDLSSLMHTPKWLSCVCVFYTSTICFLLAIKLLLKSCYISIWIRGTVALFIVTCFGQKIHKYITHVLIFHFSFLLCWTTGQDYTFNLMI